MSYAFLAAPISHPVEPGIPQPLLTLTLESLDGSRRIILDGSTGFTHMPGSTGLEMPPINLITAAIPGISGASLLDVRVDARRIFLPLFIGDGTGTQLEHLLRMDQLRSIIDPTTGMFRILGATTRGERELLAVYAGGLEGDDDEDRNGLIWNKVGLTAIACQPFAQDRRDRAVEFQVAAGEAGGAFLGTAGGTDTPWPRALSSSAVIGDNMRVLVASEVPVYPTLELVGPMDSFDSTMSLEDTAAPPFFGGTQWSVSIPNGVPAGQTFRMVTDPRAISFRLDEAQAAGLVARGSTLRPFYPGVNVLDVAAPGADENTRVRIRWRELHRSLW